MQRRDFLRLVGSSAATLTLPNAAAANGLSPRSRNRRSIYIDAQGIIGGLNDPQQSEVLIKQLEAVTASRQIDIISQWIPPVGNVQNALQIAVDAIGKRDKAIAEKGRLLLKVERYSDIAKAVDDRKIGVIYNLQDSSAHQGDVGNVPKLADLGAKIMQLTYNKRNLAGDGCLESDNAGLSEFGRELVGKINETRVVLDLSHSGQKTTAEAIKLSTAPLIIGHGGCRALNDNPRNTYDQEMRAVADGGGVFGIFLMPFLRASKQPGKQDLHRHLDHALRVCGEDHIGIGTDNYLRGVVVDDAARQQQREAFEQRQKAGIVAPGEASDVFYFVEGYNDAGRYDSIGSDLRKRGWSTRQIEKLLGENFLRVFREVWKA